LTGARFTATYFGANGWLLQLGTLRVLVDPWLVGPLCFPPGPWLLEGRLPHGWPTPEGVDLLLLTQGLEDHCHRQTLGALPRTCPVVASPGAAQRCHDLGFEHVMSLQPGETHEHGGLTIQATAGAAVPSQENGYLLRHPSARVYLEPHGFLSREAGLSPVDLVITPVLDLGLPLTGAFIEGRTVLPRLLETLQPSVVMASTTGGDVRFTGLLSRLFWAKGSLEDAKALVSATLPTCRLIDPEPGRAYNVLSLRGDRVVTPRDGSEGLKPSWYYGRQKLS